MLIKDLKGIVFSGVSLLFDDWGELEMELPGSYSIEELIEKGYGESEIEKIYIYRNRINIIMK